MFRHGIWKKINRFPKDEVWNLSIIKSRLLSRGVTRLFIIFMLYSSFFQLFIK